MVLDDRQREFILGQLDLYRPLGRRVSAIRGMLGAGTDLADVLVGEQEAMLASSMTREQIAAALVSILARLAQGEDLRYDTPQPAPPGQVLTSPPAMTPGALCPDPRWPTGT